MAASKTSVVDTLNRIVEHELAGVVRYTQYSLMIFGHARIPIISWMQAQAIEAIDHARMAGEEVTSLGSKVSLGIGDLVGTHHDSVDEIMTELVLHEEAGIVLYRDLLALTEGKNVSLEEFARQQIRAEELHVNEIKKMLKKRGDA
ncbi:MAG: bacterioferritin [Rhodothermales bacterium]|nr:bacterioferritin [Rhodothermales bacterium]